MLVLAAVASAACFCPGPMPSPQPEPTIWDPVGTALWPDGSLKLTILPTLHSGAQGATAMHMEVDATVSAPVTYPDSFRVLVFARRADGSEVGRASSPSFPPSSDAGWVDLVPIFVCPPRQDGKVIDTPLEFTVTLARESDHQLLTSSKLTVSPKCEAGSCPCQ